MKRHTVLLALLLLFSFQAFTQPPSAQQILKTAYAQAKKENKNVFVIFHASWCGWCHKMDSSMNDAVCRKFFGDNYVICHLVVHESKGKEQLESPGALELMKEYRGDQSGIPFWLIFNSDGKWLSDSKMRSEGAGAAASGINVGCPATEQEVAFFVEVLKRTSRLGPDQLKVIQKRFLQNE